VVKAAAGNSENSKNVMALLLDRRGDNVKITEEVVKVAGNSLNSKEVMTLLLHQRGEDVKITEEVVKSVAKTGHESVLNLLKQRFTIDIGAWGTRGDIFEDLLQLGCIKGHMSIVEQLLSLGANPNKADEHG
jgi:hypothetical protein